MAGTGTSNAKRGDASAMGYENSDCNPPADPYGTALDLTSYVDAKICAQVTPNFTASELDFDTVGCGGQSGFGTTCAVENREYRVSLSGDVGFQNGYDRILAQFLGESSVPAEQNVGEGDYLHILTFAANADGHFGTFAWETTQSDVIELKSTFTESINISMPGVGQPIRYTAVLVANEAECDVGAAVNNNADLQGLSFQTSELITPRCEHQFRIKSMLDDGTDIALAAGDLTPIVSFELDMETPHEVINEMTGGDCNAPTQSGERAATLTITFKEHVDNAVLSYLAWKAGTFFTADITWTGTQIGAGDNLSHTIRLPKLCLVEAPDYSITDPAINPYTLVFRVLDSENLLPGFTGNSVEFEFTNRRVGEYLLAP